MNKPKSKRWLYLLALIIPLLGCLAAMALVYGAFQGLPGNLQASASPQDLTQVVVPGEAQITMERSGAYAVYHEYRSVVDGQTYHSSPAAPNLTCRLVSGATGRQIAVVPDRVPTDAYATRGRARVGRLFGSLTVDEPGAYTFTCRYASGRTAPAAVLAVGPNLFWEHLGVFARWAAAIGAGMLVLVVSGGVAVVVVAAAALRRQPAPVTG